MKHAHLARLLFFTCLLAGFSESVSSKQVSDPQVQYGEVNCLSVEGIISEITYSFSGASEWQWVGIFLASDGNNNNPVSWAWTCTEMTVFGCDPPQDAGQGIFYIGHASSSLYELRLLSKTNQVLAKSDQFYVDCSSTLTMATFTTATVSQQCVSQTSPTCFTSIKHALQVLERYSGDQLTINIDQGKHCAEDLSINLHFNTVSFRGSSTGTSTIQYCSEPPKWPSDCVSDCFQGSINFRVESNGVEFHNLEFDGRGEAWGNPSLWDSSKVASGLAITNWIPGSQNDKRIETDISPVTGLIISQCGFSYYETAAVSLIEAQFSIEDNRFFNLGTHATKTKRQGSAGVPLFTGNSLGGAGVTVKKGGGKVSRNQIDKAEKGVEVSDSDWDEQEQESNTTDTTDVPGQTRQSSQPQKLDISENDLGGVSYGIAVGFCSSRSSINVYQNSISTTSQAALYFAHLNSSLLVSQNFIQNSRVGQIFWDCAEQVFSYQNQLLLVETGALVQSCSEFYGPSTLGASLNTLSQITITQHDGPSGYGFVVDSEPVHANCTTQSDVPQLKLDECETSSSVATAARGANAKFSDHISLYTMEGVQKLFESSGGALDPIWTIHPCPSNCSQRGSCAGVELCKCQSQANSPDLAIYVGAGCEMEAGLNWVTITSGYFQDCVDGESTKLNLTLEWTTAVGTWIGIYGYNANSSLASFIGRLQINPDMRTASIIVPAGDSPYWYAYMFSGGTTVNPVARSEDYYLEGNPCYQSIPTQIDIREFSKNISIEVAASVSYTGVTSGSLRWSGITTFQPDGFGAYTFTVIPDSLYSVGTSSIQIDSTTALIIIYVQPLSPASVSVVDCSTQKSLPVSSVVTITSNTTTTVSTLTVYPGNQTTWNPPSYGTFLFQTSASGYNPSRETKSITLQTTAIQLCLFPAYPTLDVRNSLTNASIEVGASITYSGVISGTLSWNGVTLFQHGGYGSYSFMVNPSSTYDKGSLDIQISPSTTSIVIYVRPFPQIPITVVVCDSTQPVVQTATVRITSGTSYQTSLTVSPGAVVPWLIPFFGDYTFTNTAPGYATMTQLFTVDNSTQNIVACVRPG